MYPTLFTIGKWNIPTYTVLLDLGLILGLLLTYLEGKRQLKDGTLALDLGLWAVIGGIVGGRLGYVLANWMLFSEDWLRAIRIWEGGLSFHGAFLGGLLVMILFALLHRRNVDQVPASRRGGIVDYFFELADVVTPGLALAITFGWAACLMGGCAYGALGQGFGHMVLPDLFGVSASRFATQAVGLAYSLVLFVGFWLLRGHWPFPGASFSMYVLLYFAGQFFLGFTRGDEAIYLGPWRLAQALDLLFALAAAVCLIVLWWRAGHAVEEPESQEPEQAAGPGAEEEVKEIEGTEASEVAEEAQVPAGSEGVEERQFAGE